MSALVSRPRYKAILITTALFALYAHFGVELYLIALERDFVLDEFIQKLIFFIVPVFLPGLVVGFLARKSGFMHGLILGAISTFAISLIPNSLLPKIGSLPEGEGFIFLGMIGANGITGLIGEYLAMGVARLRGKKVGDAPRTGIDDRWAKIAFRILVIVSSTLLLSLNETLCPNLEAGVDYMSSDEMLQVMLKNSLYTYLVLLPIQFLYIASLIGLLFFEYWARPMAIATGLLSTPAINFLFDSISTCSAADTVYTLSCIALGAVFVLSYTPPISKYFRQSRELSAH